MNSGSIEYSVGAPGRDSHGKITDFVFRVNPSPEHGSSFCYGRRDDIFGEISSCKQLVTARRGDELIGVVFGYTDKNKHNTDVNLMIAPELCDDDYNALARGLFAKYRAALGKDMKYTFFFSSHNTRCARFLCDIGANREVNEYGLILRRGCERNLSESNTDVKSGGDFGVISELCAGNEHDCRAFAALHDEIFPDVYISGDDIINDLSRGADGKHAVLTCRCGDSIIAYCVLFYKSAGRFTAEIVGVRPEFRHMGYGKRVLSYCIRHAFYDGSENADIIDMIVDSDNENALGLYFSLGFEIEFENNCFTIAKDSE